MARTPDNHRKPWSAKDKSQLKRLAKGNTPTDLIALKLSRTSDAIRSTAQREHVSLAPPNVPPYGVGGKRRQKQ